jgi:hypothetical protein
MIIGGATDRAYFIGLVDNTGMNSLPAFDLFVSDFGSIGYTSDTVISSQTVAIPGQGSFIALAIVGGNRWWQRGGLSSSQGEVVRFSSHQAGRAVLLHPPFFKEGRA